MGNIISNGSSGSTGKVILLDGTVHEYDKPLTAAELMLEHPQQVVVEFNSAVEVNGSVSKRPSPLPADKKLEMGKVYLMLPMKRGKLVALSAQEARQLLTLANTVLSSSPGCFFLSTTGFVPIFARFCGAGSREGQRGVVMKIREENLGERREEAKILEDLDEILEGRPEFLSRQFSGKGWKPSLDTIKEKVVKKKVSRWLF